MKNIKTTIAGLIAGLPMAAQAIYEAYVAGQFTGKTGAQLIASIGLVLLALYAKDHNVTGGTIDQTTK